MVKKTKLMSPENLLIAFKSITAGIVASLVAIIPLALGYMAINGRDMIVLGRILQIVGLLIHLQLYGYFANKFWGWK